jgi:methyltransferase
MLAPGMRVLMGLDSRLLYTGLVVLVSIGRLAELRIAGRNRALLLARGGVETAAEHYPWMVALHTAFLFSCPLEVWLFDRPLLPPLAASMLAVEAGAVALRWWVIRTLGGRWTTRIVVLPGAPPVAGGPYRRLRHPNYLAVCLEIAALPLIHSAWCTAVAFSLLNAWLLWVRIRAEEQALAGSSNYGEIFARTPRWVPRAR